MAVRGRRIELDQGRIVFVGESDIKADTVYVAFRNRKGDDLKFTLSDDAFAALKVLITDPAAGIGGEDFPHKTEWRAVDSPN